MAQVAGMAGMAVEAGSAEENLSDSIRAAIVTGGVAFLLFALIIGLKTENAHEKLVLVSRLNAAMGFALLAAGLRLLVDLLFWRGWIRQGMGPVFSTNTVGLLISISFIMGAYFFLFADRPENAARSVAAVFGADGWSAWPQIILIELIVLVFVAAFAFLLAIPATLAVALAAAGMRLLGTLRFRGEGLEGEAGPPSVLKPANLLVSICFLIGAYFFLIPGAREGFATSVAGFFSTEEWRTHARIGMELLGFLFLTAFIVLTAMLLMVIARRGLSALGIGSEQRSADFVTEVGAQFPPALLLIALVLPLLVTGPQQSYALDTAVQVLMYIMLGWGLNVVVGLAGLLDLGYVAFYAVGAYSYALIATGFGWSFWVCLPLAGLFAAMWGIILGFPVLRLRGDYLAIVTLAFGEIIRIVLLNWQSLTNGPNGISRIPRPTFFGLSFDRNAENSFHGFFGLEYSSVYRLIFMYYLILALALLVNFVTSRLRRLPLGRAWEALREDEIACRSLGINTVTTKLSAFAIGAMFGGFAGSFFATRQGFISPESFTFHESALVLAIVVLGGLGSQLGIVVAAVALIGSSEFFRDLEEYRMLIFGASMVVIMIWRPRGLVSSRTPTVVLKESKAISGSLVKEGHG